MKIKYNPRKLVELALEVMRRTVPEPRKDGRASPLVGAVYLPGHRLLYQSPISAKDTEAGAMDSENGAIKP